MTKFTVNSKRLTPPILRIMRMMTFVSGLVMWCSSVLTAHVASAQSITLQLQDAQVETVFEQIEKQSGRTFVYQPGDLTDVNRDRKSTRLNSSHVKTSYAVFCLNKKNC